MLLLFKIVESLHRISYHEKKLSCINYSSLPLPAKILFITCLCCLNNNKFFFAKSPELHKSLILRESLNKRAICTSNYMFGRAIWDKLPDSPSASRQILEVPNSWRKYNLYLVGTLRASTLKYQSSKCFLLSTKTFAVGFIRINWQTSQGQQCSTITQPWEGCNISGITTGIMLQL